MIRLRLRAIGAAFNADDEGSDYLSSDEAKRAAVKAGLPSPLTKLAAATRAQSWRHSCSTAR
jgi:hypothetical protein